MKAWEDFLILQEQELGKASVDQWLRSLKVLRFDARNLYLEGRDKFHLSWCREHLLPRTKNFLNGNGQNIRLRLSLKPQTFPPKAFSIEVASPQNEKAPQLEKKLFSFDLFIQNKHNSLAYASIKSFSQNSEDSPIPLYVYGPSGSGKTHLLKACAYTFGKGKQKVLYTHAHQFTNKVVQAMRRGNMEDFRQEYRELDLLIIDDVQLFARKAATQEEFFHTFNSLHIRGKSILLSANCAPWELSYIEERLTSRFTWGLSLPIDILAPQDISRLLRAHADNLAFPLSPIALQFLSQKFQHPNTAIRALKALILRAQFKKIPPQVFSIPMLTEELSDLLQEEKEAQIHPKDVVNTVASLYGICSTDILGSSRQKNFSQARQLSMYICREKLSLPYMKIGEHFSRDHSTVMASICKMRTILKQNESLRHSLEQALKKLKA